MVRLTLNAALTDAEMAHVEAAAHDVLALAKPWDWPAARRARTAAQA